MSPNNVNDLASSFVQMAKAFEEQPALHARVSELEQTVEDKARQVQELQIHIIDYKATITDLLAKQRDLEVARDDAELRFLEAEDKSGKALRRLDLILADMSYVRGELDPPKLAEPTPIISEVKPIGEDPTLGASTEPHAPVADTIYAGSNATPFDDGGPYNEPSPSQGQSEADPTPDPVTTSQESDVKDTAPPSAATDATSSSPAPKPYAGKRYDDVIEYISFDKWLDGGGTAENYWAKSSRF